MNPLSELRIALASDHAGYNLKLIVNEWLISKGAETHDFGCFSTESCDYPDFAHPLAVSVENGDYDFGITICSTGNGICMTANKHQGIRAALCWQERIAELARQHNNANVLGIPANFVSTELALKMVDIFFTTDFEGGRHERRVNKIPVH
ncbi:MAG: ribose 5-phosphate isomerase B [Paludibacteraceae bacterium]|nr:ribose 5-phosphate isomerase B [Paludibacteraceae bacterium]